MRFRTEDFQKQFRNLLSDIEMAAKTTSKILKSRKDNGKSISFTYSHRILELYINTYKNWRVRTTCRNGDFC